MAGIPSGEPPILDSRLRGNDGCAKVSESGNRQKRGSVPLSNSERFLVPGQLEDYVGRFGSSRNNSRLPLLSSSLSETVKCSAISDSNSATV